MAMHEDLRWLAENVSKWPGGLDNKVFSEGGALWNHTAYGNFHGVENIDGFNFAQWLHARQELGIDNTETPEEKEAWDAMEEKQASSRSDGSTASYYQLPAGCTELQHLISHRNMNAQIGEIFRACYRYGMASHSDQMRDARKILFYAMAEVERLEMLEKDNDR